MTGWKVTREIKSYLIASVGEAGVSFGQDAFHSDNERPFNFKILPIDVLSYSIGVMIAQLAVHFTATMANC